MQSDLYLYTLAFCYANMAMNFTPHIRASRSLSLSLSFSAFLQDSCTSSSSSRYHYHLPFGPVNPNPNLCSMISCVVLFPVLASGARSLCPK